MMYDGVPVEVLTYSSILHDIRPSKFEEALEDTAPVVDALVGVGAENFAGYSSSESGDDDDFFAYQERALVSPKKAYRRSSKGREGAAGSGAASARQVRSDVIAEALHTMNAQRIAASKSPLKAVTRAPPPLTRATRSSRQRDLLSVFDAAAKKGVGEAAESSSQDEGSQGTGDVSHGPLDPGTEVVPADQDTKGAERGKRRRLIGKRRSRLASASLLAANVDQLTGWVLDKYAPLFLEWVFLLRQGFNLLGFGFGSKKALMEHFAKVYLLPDGPVVIVNGYLRNLTLRDVLSSIVNTVLGLDELPGNYVDCLDLIQSKFEAMGEEAAFESETDEEWSRSSRERARLARDRSRAQKHSFDHVFLVIHNIDGEVFRTDVAKEVLSLLAAIPQVHIMASIDNINAPFLWNHQHVSRFRFIWYDMTTLMHYHEEVADVPQLLTESGSASYTGIFSVLRSLTERSRQVFSELARMKLGSQRKDIPFTDWFEACKAKFLVTTMRPLENYLKEYVDHNIITRANNRGRVVLKFKTGDDVLKLVLKEFPVVEL